MPMRVIAKKRCRAMVEPPEKGERATLNSNLSTRLKPTFFRSGPLDGGLGGHGSPDPSRDARRPDDVRAHRRHESIEPRPRSEV
jgi:hypothetical protein